MFDTVINVSKHEAVVHSVQRQVLLVLLPQAIDSDSTGLTGKDAVCVLPFCDMEPLPFNVIRVSAGDLKISLSSISSPVAAMCGLAPVEVGTNSGKYMGGVEVIDLNLTSLWQTHSDLMAPY